MKDNLLTQNFCPGETVYGEKVIESNKNEFRVWNPYRSKLGAGILCGLDYIFMKKGSKVLYLGAATGTTVSHVSDIVGDTGLVFAVEFSEVCGKELLSLAYHRKNIIPIVADARYPQSYSSIVSFVDVIFSDVAQKDQARIVGINADYYLKENGGILISIKASSIDSLENPNVIFANEVQKLKEFNIKPKEQVMLDPYEKAHAVVAGIFRPSKK